MLLLLAFYFFLHIQQFITFRELLSNVLQIVRFISSEFFVLCVALLQLYSTETAA